MAPFDIPSPESKTVEAGILERVNEMSHKVRQQVLEKVIPNIHTLGSFAPRWLSGLQNDFFTLVNNPDDACGHGEYHGWTAQEIREMYFVLFGEEME